MKEILRLDKTYIFAKDEDALECSIIQDGIESKSEENPLLFLSSLLNTDFNRILSLPLKAKLVDILPGYYTTIRLLLIDLNSMNNPFIDVYVKEGRIVGVNWASALSNLKLMSLMGEISTKEVNVSILIDQQTLIQFPVSLLYDGIYPTKVATPLDLYNINVVSISNIKENKLLVNGHPIGNSDTSISTIIFKDDWGYIILKQQQKTALLTVLDNNFVPVQRKTLHTDRYFKALSILLSSGNVPKDKIRNLFQFDLPIFKRLELVGDVLILRDKDVSLDFLGFDNIAYGFDDFSFSIHIVPRMNKGIDVYTSIYIAEENSVRWNMEVASNVLPFIFNNTLHMFFFESKGNAVNIFYNRHVTDQITGRLFKESIQGSQGRMTASVNLAVVNNVEEVKSYVLEIMKHNMAVKEIEYGI